MPVTLRANMLILLFFSILIITLITHDAVAQTTEATTPPQTEKPTTSNNRMQGMGMDHQKMMAMGKHAHKDEEMPVKLPTPQLSLSLQKDAMDGFNLILKTAHYQFIPPGISTIERGDQSLHGHAHLYINGKKISRIYSPYVHIPEKYLDKKINQLTLTLNSDRHGVWTKDKKQILATLFINPNQEPAVLHQFATFPLHTSTP